jgi:hypothetical protein
MQVVVSLRGRNHDNAGTGDGLEHVTNVVASTPGNSGVFTVRRRYEGAVHVCEILAASNVAAVDERRLASSLMIDGDRRGAADRSKEIWQLLTPEVWYRQQGDI